MQSPLPQTPPAEFDSARFRRALSQFATGVTIVTTRDAEGRPVGLTANSFNSVSLDPPLVLWSLALRARSLSAFRAHSHYAINVLAADQVELARRFAGPQAERFVGTPFRIGRAGVPVLEGCVAWFECRNRSRYDEGDHVIFVGHVESCGMDAKPPLLFYHGKFRAGR